MRSGDVGFNAWLLTRSPIGHVVRWVARLRLPVYGKLLGAFLLVTALFIAMGAVSLQIISSLGRQSRALDEAHGRVHASQQIEHALALQMHFTGMALLLRDDASLASILRENNRFNDTLVQLEKTAPAEERALFQETRSLQDGAMDVVADIANLVRDGKFNEAREALLTREDPLLRQIGARVRQLVTAEERRMESLRASAAEATRRSLILMGSFAVVSIVLALVLGFVISWSFILPVQEADRVLAGVAEGNFGSTVTVPNRDEFGALAARINYMSRELLRLDREQREAAAQLRTLNEHLALASQAKSDFLANMSHELRTPLNAIIGFSDVLLERMFGEINDKQREYLEDIVTSGKHLLSLINDILDLSKIEAGRMELELTEFDVPQAIDNALTLIRERAARRGIQLHQTVDERLDTMRADERKMKQVLLNLLSNAVKFTPEGGRVDVHAGIDTDTVEISVSDTGIGIAAEDQAAVFEEFRQVGSADKKAEGTGLGLALCRKFVELHGGRIWVESELGKGSTFCFTVPLRADAADIDSRRGS